MAQSLLSNTGIASAGRIINILIGITVTATLTRLLGTAGYGSYALLISFGMIFQIAADFGLYLTLTRDIAAEPTKAQRLHSTIASLRITLLIVLLSVGVIIAFFIPAYRSLVLPLIVVSFGLALQSLSQLQMGIYQVHGIIWRATVGDLAGRVAQLTLVLLFPLLSLTMPPLLYFAIAFTIGTGLAYIIHSLLLPAIKPLKLKADWQKWKAIAKKSWPLGALLVLNIIYFRVDIVMLSFWHPGEQVGWYGLAYRIIESGLFFPAMFGGLLLPQISAALTKSKKASAQKLLNQSIYLIILFIPLILITLIPLSEKIVTFLSGNSYGPAAPLLQILSLALAVMFIGNIFGFALVSLKKQKQLLSLYLILVGVNIITNALFIPVFAAAAAAWTTVATEALAMITAGWMVYRSLPFSFPVKSISVAIIIAISTGLVASRIPSSWHVIVQIGIITAFYLTALFSTGLLKRTHISLLLKSS